MPFMPPSIATYDSILHATHVLGVYNNRDTQKSASGRTWDTEILRLLTSVKTAIYQQKTSCSYDQVYDVSNVIISQGDFFVGFN